MKFTLFTVLLIFLSENAIGQLSVKNLKLPYGEYTIGYQHQLKYDSSRSYNFIQKSANTDSYRPMSISIWYPAVSAIRSTSNYVKTLNYLEVYKLEKEWEQLPNEQLLNWFEYPNTPKNRRILGESSMAFKNPEWQKGKFPVVIYSPGYEGSSVENFALCELLASHGYIVVASPGRGSDDLYLNGGTLIDIETQARDIEFLIGMVNGWEYTDKSKIAVMGFSFGGLSNVLTQMKNEQVKAIVSIDGSIKYQYKKLKDSPFFSINKVDVPFIHLAQKDIPEEILKSDNLDPGLNTDFKFFDDLKYSDAYAFKFHHLTHSNFTTLGVLLSNRDPRQDKSDEKIMVSHKITSQYILHFLNGHLLSDSESIEFLKNDPEANGFEEQLISRKHKKANQKPVSFSDFNEQMMDSEYHEIPDIYHNFRSVNPEFKIEESQLNTLALQWLYNSEKPDNGIKVLNFAVSLFPNSSNLFDSLGEGYLVIRDEKNALKSFKEAVRLDANNFNSAERIKQLSDADK